MKPLRKVVPALFYLVDGEKIMGKNPRLRGDCSGLWGNCGGLRGDCSGLWGNCGGLWGNCGGLSGDLDEITPEQRKESGNISDYVEAGE